METNKEVYGKGSSFSIEFEMPNLVFKTLKTPHEMTALEKLSKATSRRFFYLANDWEIDIATENFPDLNGRLVIPREINGEVFEFDGASIPVPWLISLLTIGILRPLGIMLIASIVHDFAFRYGFLIKKEDNSSSEIALDRGKADDLFRDIIKAVSGSKLISFVGWYAVRIGYFLGVKYNGKSFTGYPPILVLISALAIFYLIYKFFMAFVILYCLAYIGFYLISLTYLNKK